MKNREWVMIILLFIVLVLSTCAISAAERVADNTHSTDRTSAPCAEEESSKDNGYITQVKKHIDRLITCDEAANNIL